MLFDTTVSDLQTGLSVNGEAGGDGSVSGTLKFLDSGPIAEYWGAGYFMALKFQPGDEDATVSVGLDPSEGSGLVPLDEDLNGVFKVTDPESQTFVVETVKDGQLLRQTFGLAGLSLTPPTLEFLTATGDQPLASLDIVNTVEKTECTLGVRTVSGTFYADMTEATVEPSGIVTVFTQDVEGQARLSGLGPAREAPMSSYRRLTVQAPVTIGGRTMTGTASMDVKIVAGPLNATPPEVSIVADGTEQNGPLMTGWDDQPRHLSNGDATVDGTPAVAAHGSGFVRWYWPAAPADLGPDQHLLTIYASSNTPGQVVLTAEAGLELDHVPVVIPDKRSTYTRAEFTLTVTAS